MAAYRGRSTWTLGGRSVTRSVAAFVLLMWAHAAFASDALDELTAARAKWGSQHLRAYSFVVKLHFPMTLAGDAADAFAPIRIEVRDGRRVSATVAIDSDRAGSGRPVHVIALKYLPKNMDALFDEIESALKRGAGRIVSVRYNFETGCPESFSDIGRALLDTDSGFEVQAVHAVR